MRAGWEGRGTVSRAAAVQVCKPAGPSCSPPAGRGRPGPAMESYDIIANQPVVIDNVRPGSRGGEDGRPAPGAHAAASGGTPARLD